MVSPRKTHVLLLCLGQVISASCVRSGATVVPEREDVTDLSKVETSTVDTRPGLPPLDTITQDGEIPDGPLIPDGRISDGPLSPDALSLDRTPTADRLIGILLLPVIADASVKDGSPDKNFGDSDELCLGFCSAAANNNMKSWIKLDLSPLPSNATIISARLNLYFFIHWNSQDYQLFYSAEDGWVEQDITWNNQPAADPTPLDTCPAFTVNKVWKSFDITPLVVQEVAGDKILSVMIQGATLFDPLSNPDDYENYAYSREAGDLNLRPYLELTLAY